MASNKPKWLRTLIVQRAEFLEAVERSTGLSIFAHLLRAAVDERPLSERIEDSVRRVAPSLPAVRYTDPKAARSVIAAIERRLPELPLAEIPCEESIANALQRIDAKNRQHLGGEIGPVTRDGAYASTLRST